MSIFCPTKQKSALWLQCPSMRSFFRLSLKKVDEIGKKLGHTCSLDFSISRGCWVTAGCLTASSCWAAAGCWAAGRCLAAALYVRWRISFQIILIVDLWDHLNDAQKFDLNFLHSHKYLNMFVYLRNDRITTMIGWHKMKIIHPGCTLLVQTVVEDFLKIWKLNKTILSVTWQDGNVM